LCRYKHPLKVNETDTLGYVRFAVSRGEVGLTAEGALCFHLVRPVVTPVPTSLARKANRADRGRAQPAAGA